MVYRRNSCIKGPPILEKKNHEIYANGWRTKIQVPFIMVDTSGTSQNEFKWLNLLIQWHFLTCLHFPSSRLDSQTIDASTSPEEFRAKPLRYNAFLGRQKASPTDLHRLDGNSGKPRVAMVRNNTHMYTNNKRILYLSCTGHSFATCTGTCPSIISHNIT